MEPAKEAPNLKDSSSYEVEPDISEVTDIEDDEDDGDRSQEESFSNSKGKRTRRLYPPASFKDSLELGAAIVKYASGGKVRLLTLCEKMGRSATSGLTRQMMANSAKYGITRTTQKSEWIELTLEGQIIFDEARPKRNILETKFKLAIEKIPPFKKLYDEYVKKRLPATEVMRDFLQSTELQIDDYKECIDLFIVNVEDLDLLRTIGGAATLIPVEQALDELPTRPIEQVLGASIVQNIHIASNVGTESEVSVSLWHNICFYITPIGDEGTEQRKHSDLFLGSLIEPAVSELGLQVVRADKIGQPGMITTQIIEHVKRARLVIVDLSFLNPNVFYEMALRHACKMPIVHIIRKADQVPFDVSQNRCIFIDNTDIYSFVPKLQTYRAEIATQARKALEDPEHSTNPISVFYPGFWRDAQ